MNPDKSIVEFLCRDENLSLALEVAEAMDAVHERVEDQFLNLIHSGIAAKFSASSFSRNWVLEKEIDGRGKNRRQATVCLVPNPATAAHYLHYVFSVSRYGSDFDLWYGLSWWGETAEEPKGFSTDKCTVLNAYLLDNEFKRTTWILGLKTIIAFTGRKELLLALRQREAELTTRAVQDFWALFEKTEKLTRVVNKSLEVVSTKK